MCDDLGHLPDAVRRDVDAALAGIEEGRPLSPDDLRRLRQTMIPLDAALVARIDELVAGISVDRNAPLSLDDDLRKPRTRPAPTDNSGSPPHEVLARLREEALVESVGASLRLSGRPVSDEQVARVLKRMRPGSAGPKPCSALR